MKKVFVHAFLLCLPVIGVQAGELKSYEMPRTHVVALQDSKAGRQYELYIKLPEDYSKNSDAKYPVIYTTDAKWQMDMLSGATEYLMSNVILVGLSWQTDLDDERDFISRLRDYTVVEVEDPELQAKYHFGQADHHLGFLRDDVIEYVEDNYRVDPARRTYFGYSLGGLFGAYVLLAEPEIFTYYILGSPAVDERDLAFLNDLEMNEASQTVSAFISIGELEDGQMAVTKDLFSLLQRKNPTTLALTGIEVIQNSDHGTAFPDTVVRGVKWLSQQITE